MNSTPPKPPTATLALAALGVVYGDIGTSPIYALRACFFGANPVAPTAADVLGILSLIVWSLFVVVTLKYLLFLMRADNHGEGGIVALVALLNPWHAQPGSLRRVLMLLGLFGAALLYGDGTITPAISVLSAVEGLKVATPYFEPYVIPITVAILIGLFLLQKRGTGGIGKVFGPVMCVWFLALAALGLRGIAMHPGVLAALSPVYAVEFFVRRGGSGFPVLGAVFLAVTGAETLYADMGHFGRRPIRAAWFCVALPALLLNYFGQGALILSGASAAHQPFYDLAPAALIYPLVALTAMATVIASQAVIAGAFSLTRQLVTLGQLPRVNVIQTSPEERGQIYIPSVNWMLMLATIGLVLGFKSSAALAAAYGIAVSATMVITTTLAYFVARRFHMNPLLTAAICLVFFAVDLAFFGANLYKVADGGWYPIVAALGVFTIMTTWARGRLLLRRHLDLHTESLAAFVAHIEESKPYRIPGTGVFPTSGDATPPRLLQHLDRHKVLNERIILLTVATLDVPRVPASARLEIAGIGSGIFRVTARYGFMQDPNVPLALKLCQAHGVDIDLRAVTYYVGRETLVPSKTMRRMPLWREHLFAFLSRNAMRATAFYRLPADDVVELGFQVDI